MHRPTAALLAVAAALVVAAVVLALLEAGAALRGPVTAAAVLATVLGAAPRGSGRRHLVVSAGGALLVGAVLVGVVLDVLPGGITRASWAVSAGLLGLLALAMAARRGTPAVLPRLRRLPRPGTGTTWYVAAAAVVAAAAWVSVDAARDSERAPVQFALENARAGSVEVVLTASQRSGPYDVVAVAGKRSTTLERDVVVTPGLPLRLTVPAPEGERVVVRLLPGDDPEGKPLRTLVVDPS
ncbi:hypothetical protein [Motilibacter deserti]|uniref:Uncharacterized protein n=1 Tax=Motilibacter deserti TaxID=2714956 RepID=A0ABX0GSH8_9ACTN|nr:hypothetical protein [Motilibacter deserti]NHC13463.1 hypothetical protein [Motilibacter deserti]